MDSPLKGNSISFRAAAVPVVNGKQIVDFDENCALTALKKFVREAYLRSQHVWLMTINENSSSLLERVWICKFDWEQDSFCIINPERKSARNPSGVVILDIDGDISVRIGLAWSFVEYQQSVMRCYFLGSDFSRPANFPENNRIFRFHALLDQSGEIVDPHFEKCKILSHEKSLCEIGDWAPEGCFNYDIRRNSEIRLGDRESISNNCQMAVFEQLKTAGYIAFANFKQFCVECEVPEDFVKVPTSTLEMNPTQCKKFFAGTVDIVDCNVTLEWQSDRAGRISRVTLDLQCHDMPEKILLNTSRVFASAARPPVCHVCFEMKYCAGDSTTRFAEKGHVLINTAQEVDSGLHSASADSRY